MGRRLALEECVRDGACPLLVGVGCDLGSGVRLPGVCLLCPVGTREQRLAFGGCVRAGACPPLVLRFRLGGCVCLLCVCFVRWLWSKTLP